MVQECSRVVDIDGGKTLEHIRFAEMIFSMHSNIAAACFNVCSTYCLLTSVDLFSLTGTAYAGHESHLQLLRQEEKAHWPTSQKHSSPAL